jgi:inositol polyphosphate-4-phosphatase
MAVTWDQARLLYEQHGLSDHDVQTALNLMRTEGVRKLNVVKNTGQSAYAFNVLQRSFLPAIFRPPENACSSSIEG